MSVQVKCPNGDCDQQLVLSPEMAGKKGQCPKCNKTFQIPANFGQKKAAAPKSADNQMSSDALADYLVEDDGTPQSGSMAQVDVIESYEADVVDDYEDYEEPRPKRRRRRDDYDDYEEEDDDDDGFESSARAKGGMTKTRKRKLLNVGFLIVAIATCVMAGSFAMSIVAEMFGEIAIAANKSSLYKAMRVFFRIAQVVGFLASLGLVTGYVFCLFAPNKHGTLGLSIAALSVGTINMVMWIVFKMVKAFGSGNIYSRNLFAINGGQNIGAEYVVLLMFLELILFAEFILITLFMTAVAKMQKDKAHRRDCMQTVWFLTAVCSVVFIESIFMMIDFSDRWPVYLIRTMNWGANGVLVIAMVFHIMNVFYSWRSTK